MNTALYIRIKPYWKFLFFTALASALLVTALQMSTAKNRWNEVVNHDVAGTKGRNAAIGALGGSAAGGAAGLLIGGIGVALCGTGIGIPAGVMLIGGAVVGAGAGATAGAAIGTPAYSYQTQIQHVEAAYRTWHWAGLLVIALILFAVALHEYKQCVRSSLR